MAINNPYIPGDPFSYDLKWIIQKIKEHSSGIQANSAAIDSLEERMPTLEEIKKYLQEAVAAGRLSYITPEMFGAVGDGQTDDTEAFQNAVNIGVPIVCSPNKNYRLKQIDLIDHSDINGNGSEFTAIDPILFYAAGEAVNYGAVSLAYSAGDRDISLSVQPSAGNILYIKDESYTYRSQDGVDYKAGGLCEVETEIGSQPAIMPAIQFDLSAGASVTEYKPITVTIRNISNVTFEDVPNCISAFYLLANKHSLVEGCSMDGAFRDAVALNYCYQTIITNCNFRSTYVPPELYYYIISIGGASYRTVVSNCNLQSTWNVISDVGNTPVVNTVIENTVLKCSTNYPAYLSHCCAIDTFLTNCSIDGVQLANSATMVNCHIYDRGDGAYSVVAILADEDPDNKWVYRLDNVTFHGKSNTYCGIRLASHSSGTIYKLLTSDLTAADGATTLYLGYSAALTKIKEIVMEGCFLDMSSLNIDHTTIETCFINNTRNIGSFVVNDGVINAIYLNNFEQRSTGTNFVVPCEKMFVDNARFYHEDPTVRASMGCNGKTVYINNLYLENDGRLYPSAVSDIMITCSTFSIASMALGRKLTAKGCCINGNSSMDIIMDQTTGQLYYHRLNNGAIQLVALN